MIRDLIWPNGALILSPDGSGYAGGGTYSWSDTPEMESFYFPDYFLTAQKPWLHFEKTVSVTLDELAKELDSHPKSPSLTGPWQSSYSEIFDSSFAELQNLIGQGALQKAVPYIFETARATVDQPLFFSCLKEAVNYALQNPVYLYGFWQNGEGLLGATPELLFQADSSNKVRTVACAGTCPKEKKNSFASDPKELHEHHLVVQGISEALNPLGKVTLKPQQVLELSTLCHLVTPIEVAVDDEISFDTLAKTLHPTPALGAYPKERGMEWLKKYDNLVPRGRFGAPAGFISKNGEKMCCVGIRNMQWLGDKINLGAGCGVVGKSVLPNEREELKLKIGSIKRIFGL